MLSKYLHKPVIECSTVTTQSFPGWTSILWRLLRSTGSDASTTRFRCFRWRLIIGILPLLITLPASAQLIPSFGEARTGTSGFQFLEIAVDARAAALGQSVVASAFDASALYWNPALAAQTSTHQIGLSHSLYYVGTRLDYLGAIYHVGGFALGGHAIVFDSGEMDLTTVYAPFGNGQTFRLLNVAAGLTVAQSLTDRFSYGVTGKWVRESVAGVSASTAAVDLGMFYRVGDTGAQLAVSLRNFGLDAPFGGELERPGAPGADSTTVIENDFEDISMPTVFLMGVSYELWRGNPNHSLLVAGQLTNPADNAETINIGVEYSWRRFLILRTGYRFGVEEATLPSLGLGLRIANIAGLLDARFDYAYTRMNMLGAVHRIGFNAEF